MKVELGKEYRTECGYRVKLLTDELMGDYPFLGIVYRVMGDDREKLAMRFTMTGKSDCGFDGYDLVEVKPYVVIERRCNVIKDRDDLYSYITTYRREENARMAPNNRLTSFRLKITIEEGRIDYPLVEATIGGVE